MTLKYADRVKEVTTTSGTGSFTLSRAATGGFQRFQDVLSVNDICYYAVQDSGANAWEVGLGTLTNVTTLARTVVLASSNGGALVNFSGGAKDIILTIPASVMTALRPYGTDIHFTLPAAPGAATAALAGLGAGNVDSGDHSYKVTFASAEGETQAGTASNTITTTGGNGQVALSAIPLGASGTTARKIYRTLADGELYYLLATISNNTTTTYADNVADASLTTPAPVLNTSGGAIYSGANKALAVDQNGNLVVNKIVNYWASDNGSSETGTLLVANAINTDNLFSGASTLLDLQLNGVSQFAVDYAGGVDALGDFVLNGANKLATLYVGPSPVIGSQTCTFKGEVSMYDDNDYATFDKDAFGHTELTVWDDVIAGVSSPLTVSHETLGTPADGFGTSIPLQGDSDNNTKQPMALIASIWDTAAELTRKASLHLDAYDTVIRPNVTIGANGSAPTLGVLGATPVTRPVVTGSRGGNAALASLLTGLALAGYITDSSTA